MEPVTQALAIVLGPLGIWLGWHLNQRSTRENTRISFQNQQVLAEKSLEGQRTLAADAAKRDRRKALVDPYRGRMRTRLDQYGELMDALARHDFNRCLALFDAIIKPPEVITNLMDMLATGDPHIRETGAALFSAETNCWNVAVLAFNNPTNASIAAVGDPVAAMWQAFGLLTKATDDYVTRLDSGTDIDLRANPEAAPTIPIQFVRIAPRRDADHPWFGRSPLMSSPGPSPQPSST